MSDVEGDDAPMAAAAAAAAANNDGKGSKLESALDRLGFNKRKVSIQLFDKASIMRSLRSIFALTVI